MARSLTAKDPHIREVLAGIRRQNVSSHDLKAQRKAHSVSLLFDPVQARDQDFETIYQTCVEGFEELCHLDSRFSQFASNVFSEESKCQDPSQMTQEQNRRLDARIGPD